MGGKRFYNKQNGIYYKVEAGRLVEDYSFADSQIEDLDHRFENEQQNRMDEDDKIKRHIDDLEEGVKNADKLLSQRITDLEKGVADADKFLSDRITTEQTARTEADNALREVTDSYTEHMKAEHYNHRPIVIANFYKLSNPTSEQIRAAFLPAGRTIMDLHDRLREGVEMVMTKDDNPANRYGKFEVCRCHSVSMELTGDHTGFSLWFGVNLFGSNKTVERFYQIKLLNGVFTCSYYTNG